MEKRITSGNDTLNIYCPNPQQLYPIKIVMENEFNEVDVNFSLEEAEEIVEALSEMIATIKYF
jgi:hypothetical protein